MTKEEARLATLQRESGSRAATRMRWTKVSAVVVHAASMGVQASAAVDEGSECRLIRLDETAFQVPSGGSYGPLEGVKLMDDRDLTPLLEADNTLGPRATVRLEAYVSSKTCVPYSLAITTDTGGISVPLSAPARGWKERNYNSLVAAIQPEHYTTPATTHWADLDKLEVYYSCDSPPQTPEEQIRVQLVRVCKELPEPSYCAVESTDTYKTDGYPCDCEKCHDCGKCSVLWSGECQYDRCTESKDCFCAPLCKCCWQCPSRVCNCKTCYQTRSYQSCSKLLHYGIASISPSSGPQAGGTRVVITATTSFLKTDHLSCRFGNAVVPAALVSATEITCTAPEMHTTNTTVPLAVSLDGQRWTQQHDAASFRYCVEGDATCGSTVCPQGWTGADCRVECNGGAATPCSRHGVCLHDGSCACVKGWTGRACEAVAADDIPSGIPSGGGGAGIGHGVRVGMLLGIFLSISLVVASAGVLYIRREEVLESVFWRLAASRFQRLHPHDSYEDDNDPSGPPQPPIPPNHQHPERPSSSVYIPWRPKMTSQQRRTPSLHIEDSQGIFLGDLPHVSNAGAVWSREMAENRQSGDEEHGALLRHEADLQETDRVDKGS